jgi:hypothetical protein
MTTDEQISRDLAVVARASRERPIDVETTLRNVAAAHGNRTLRDKPSATRATAPPVSTVAVLRVANIYVLRAGRAAAGFAAVACTSLLIVYVCLAPLIDWQEPGLLEELGWTGKIWVALASLFFIACTYLVATRVTWRRCLSLIASGDVETVRHRARRLSGVSTLSAIIGVMTFVLFFGMMQISVGGGGLGNLFSPGPVSPSLQLFIARRTIVLLDVAIAGGFVAAIFVARHAVAARAITKPTSIWIVTGIALVIATVVVGLRYDEGPGLVLVIEGMPSMWFRAGLTVTGTTGLFLIVSTLVRCITAREDAELADSEST